MFDRVLNKLLGGDQFRIGKYEELKFIVANLLWRKIVPIKASKNQFPENWTYFSALNFRGYLISSMQKKMWFCG